jgi:hypothetical protein
MRTLAWITLVVVAAPALGQGDVPRWEYRVLSKDEIVQLGKKDLTAGLNLLGDQGWELAAIDATYIFKRVRPVGPSPATTLKQQVQLAESDLSEWKERVLWSERMVRKGFLAEGKLQADRAALKAAEAALERARRELEPYLLPAPKEAPDKDAKPEK